jgi:tetratricopeptide (TPR) repeat protein/transcriptional regulator with XRE-family HTH domain
MHPLKMARELRGWSQAKVAEIIGSTSRNVRRWEKGLTIPHPYYREQLCELFGMNARDLGLLAETDAKIPGTVVVSPFSHSTEKQVSVIIDPAIPELVRGSTCLLGRDELLGQVKNYLQEGSDRTTVALHGLPGMGKTSLVVALSMDQHIKETFHDGVLWARLGLQPDIRSHLVRWAQLLGLEPHVIEQSHHVDTLCQQLRMLIGQRRLLLILDDVWSIEASQALHIGGPQCAYLLTTRQPQIAFLFAATGTFSVPELHAEEGLALLARFVPDLVQQEQENMFSLVREVGASPLALTLIGKYLALQAFSGQPRRVQTALSQLRNARQRLQIAFPVSAGERSPHLAPDIPLSLHSAIAVSGQHLEQQAQETLSALSVLPGKPESFLEEIALAVSAVPNKILDMLWEAGLLESSAPGRYTLHQTISDYAQFQGNPHILVKARKRLVTSLVQYAQTHALNYEVMEREMVTIIAALDAAIELQMDQELRQLIIACTNFMRVRCYFNTAEYYLRQALLTTIVPETITERLLIIRLLATFAELCGNYSQTREYCWQGLALAQQLGQNNIERDLLTTLGLVAFHEADYQQAQEMLGKALSLARQHSEQEQVAILMRHLGRVAYMQGQTMLAKMYYQEGLAQARNVGAYEVIGQLLAHLGAVYVRLGDYTQAEQLFQEGLEQEDYQQHLPLLQQPGYLDSLGWLLYNRGILLQIQGHYTRANANQQEVHILGHRGGRVSELCLLLVNQGLLALDQGNREQAMQYLQKGRGLAQRIGNRCYLPSILTALGTAFWQQGAFEQAHVSFQESVRLSRRCHAWWDLLYGLVSWGEFHLASQRWEEAQQCYQEGIQLEESAQIDLLLFTRAQYGLAQVARHQGAYQEAKRLGVASLATLKALGLQQAKEISLWLQSLEEVLST